MKKKAKKKLFAGLTKLAKGLASGMAQQAEKPQGKSVSGKPCGGCDGK